MTQNQHPWAPSAGPRPDVTTAKAAKATTRERLRRLKSRILLATLLGFGALSGLALGHRVGVTTHAATPPTTTAPTPVPSSGNNGGFFNQGGSGDQGGYGFGNGSSAQPPVASSGAS